MQFYLFERECSLSIHHLKLYDVNEQQEGFRQREREKSQDVRQRETNISVITKNGCDTKQ